MQSRLFRRNLDALAKRSFGFRKLVQFQQDLPEVAVHGPVFRSQAERFLEVLPRFRPLAQPGQHHAQVAVGVVVIGSRSRAARSFATASGSLLARSRRSPSLASGAAAAGWGIELLMLSGSSSQIGSTVARTGESESAEADAPSLARRRNSRARSGLPRLSAISASLENAVRSLAGTTGGP